MCLSFIRDIDNYYNLVRAFEDEEITHTENDVNLIRDRKILSTKILEKDKVFIDKRVEILMKVAKDHVRMPKKILKF